MTGLEPLISKRNTKNVLQGKRSEKEILLDKNGNMDKVVDIQKELRGKTSSSRLTWISKKGWKIFSALPLAQSCKLEMRPTPKVSML